MPDITPPPLSPPPPQEAVDAAYRFSSTALLALLEREYNLTAHLKSLQRFFLLSNGDFFVQVQK